MRKLKFSFDWTVINLNLQTLIIDQKQSITKHGKKVAEQPEKFIFLMSSQIPYLLYISVTI